METRYTLRDLKSFINKNASNLYTKTLSDFDGMADCIETRKDEFEKTQVDDAEMECHTYGLRKVWVVGGDYITKYDDGVYRGFKVSNCCGSFIVAVKVGRFYGMPVPKCGKFLVWFSSIPADHAIVKSDRSFYFVDRSTSEFSRIATTREDRKNLIERLLAPDAEVSFETWPSYFDEHLEV